MTDRRTALGLISATALAPALPWRAARAQTGGLAISIRVTAPPVTTAPAGFFFEAIIDDPAAGRSTRGDYPAEYLPGFHEFSHVWSLPDGGPVRAPAHLVADHRRTERATGPYIGHVFATPGRHRVAVEVLAPDGRRGRAEVTVEVADPAAAFGPAGTIVVSADGDFTGAPDHDPRNRVPDLVAAKKRYDALRLEQVQILLRRGQSHLPPGRGLAFKDQHAHCHIGAWGEGVAPVVDLRRGGTLIGVGEEWGGRSLVLRGLHFRGGWDPTTELWQDGEHKSVVHTFADAVVLLHNCREEGCNMTVHASQPGTPRPDGAMIFFNEYAKTDFKDFLFLGSRDGVDVSVTGCRVVQHPEALNGGENRRTTSAAVYARNAHNFIRCAARRLYIASNDIFVRHGWATGKVYDNHAFRLNRNNLPGRRAVIVRNHIEGMLARQSKADTVPMNILIEQNYIVANPVTRPVLHFRGGAATIRNNIVLEHDTPKLPKTGAGFRSFIGLRWDGKVPATGQMPFFVYNNSFVLLRRDATAKGGAGTVRDGDPGFAHVIEANNLLWAPRLARDPTGDGPLETASLGWDARYRGARLGWARLEDQTLPRQISPGEDFLVLYWTDFFGAQLSRADFAGEAGRHAIKLRIGEKQQSFDGITGEAGFRFEADGVRVTNQSPVPWPGGAGFKLHCDRGTTPTAMQTIYGHPPGTLSLYRPLPDAGAFGSAAPELLAPYDFLGNPRPGTPAPGAPAGQASRGAVEPG